MGAEDMDNVISITNRCYVLHIPYVVAHAHACNVRPGICKVLVTSWVNTIGVYCKC